MSEWWTYSLSSFLLFSPRTYYRLFELYNAALWPAQIVTLASGLAILVLILRGQGGRIVAAILAALWLLVAWAYFIERYDPINFAARYYAAAFALQAALLIWTGVIRDGLRFPPRQRWLAIALLGYALALHPAIAPLSGRLWTQAELFGLAPDPTAIATLGVMAAATRTSGHLMAVPVLWCVVSSLTLWAMESPEAPIPALVGAIAVGLAAWRSRNSRPISDG